MALARLALVDHGYHQRTGSSAFFLDLLRSRFDVVPLMDESWRGQQDGVSAEAINAINPDYVVFYQLRPRRAQLARIQCRNVVWVPMYDDVNFASSSVRRLRGTGLKVIHFSKATRSFFGEVGFSNLSVQYFPEPDPKVVPCQDDRPRIFFWARRAELGWKTLKTLLGDQRPDKIVLRLAPDPGELVDHPSSDDIGTYRIELHEGWLDRAEYHRLLRTCNVFVAPRRKEGIGMALLEAMSAGLAPLAPDAPTMNEYVRHGDNGFLFDPIQPRPLRLDILHHVRLRALESIARGHKDWRERQDEIIRFIKAPPPQQLSPAWRVRRLLRV